MKKLSLLMCLFLVALSSCGKPTLSDDDRDRDGYHHRRHDHDDDDDDHHWYDL